MLIEKIIDGQETFVIENDGKKRYNIHCANKFVLTKEIKGKKSFKCVLTIGAIILSKQLEMSSVRKLRAETMGGPGLLSLWILGKK